MFTLSFVAHRALIALAGLALASAIAPAVIASPPAVPALNPVPPDTYTCQPNGGGWTCKAHTVEPYENEQTGIICGSGAAQFEVLDSGTRDVHATRWYDANGNIVLRRRVLDFPGVHFSNPLTGKVLPYRQHNVDWDIVTVPGDLDSAIVYPTGYMIVKAPRMGVVLDGPTYDAYLTTGDASLVAKLCKALGA